MVVDSFEAGWTRCTSATHVGAALWPRLFSLVDDRFDDASNVKIVKVKAHTSAASCADIPDLISRRGGNAIADIGAKSGGALHPSDAPC